jgi:hypothetical protein
MKTFKESENFIESSINSRLDHKAFTTHAREICGVKTRKFVRSVDKNNQAVFGLLGLEDCIANSKVSIHPEFVAFMFHLYGLSKKLFLYLVFFELDNSTCTFKITDETMQRFRKFGSSFKEDSWSAPIILHAARTLVRKNVMIALDNENYMLNPLIAGGANENKRRKLINHYSELLEKKGLDTSLHYYPKYQVTK